MTQENWIEAAISEEGDDSVAITITDTGPGMKPEIAARVFDPFFTTKPAGQGTGLGLSLSRDMARDMQGELQLRKIEGGAQFAIVLARYKDA